MEYKSVSRIIYLAAGLFIAIWFAHEVLSIILLLFFAIVITIVLNAPVTWLERKKIRRSIGSLIVFFAVILCFALLGWMIVPKMVPQVKLLINNLPTYLESLNKQASTWLGEQSNDSREAQSTTNAIASLPPISAIINSVGQ
ncbi:MAG TPA: AI-2E family transporter, partial [Chitinophagaceae bacterium]